MGDWGRGMTYLTAGCLGMYDAWRYQSTEVQRKESVIECTEQRGNTGFLQPLQSESDSRKPTLPPFEVVPSFPDDPTFHLLPEAKREEHIHKGLTLRPYGHQQRV